MPGGGGGLDPGDMELDRHAFIMLGERALFLCHMTMFDMEAHCYQMICRATLPDYAMKLYRDGLKNAPLETFFLGNTETDGLTVADLASGARRSFSANIFRGVPDRPKSDGWPWDNRPGYLVVGDVAVTIERVVYFRHFDFGLEHPKTLTYILFGAGNEAHLSHFQTKEPDFDHVLTLAGAPDWVPARKLEAGLHVTFPTLPTLPIRCANPLRPGVQDVQYQGQGATRPIRIGHTWWFSTKIVNSEDPCAPRRRGKK
jgi:hypothetical protein